jgi:hypothetical protein
MPRIRMIKDETEPGVTLDVAKAAAKDIGSKDNEPIVIYNDTLGKHMPNFQSDFVKQNLSAAWATARVMDKSMVEGEESDPMDIWLDQQAKMAQMKEILGVAPETGQKGGTLNELVEALRALKEMMPATPAPNTESETTKQEIAELKSTIATLTENIHKQEIETLKQQMVAISETSKKQVEDLLSKIENIKAQPVGRTEMDVISDIASQGISLAKSELPGLRKDIKDALSSVSLPMTKTSEQRADRKNRYRQAIEADSEIEELGRQIFFPEG